MENKLNPVPEDYSQDLATDADDDISLCNFAISGYEQHDDDVVAAASGRTSNASENEFCFHEVNEFRKRDYLCLKTASFHKARGFEFEWDDDYHEEEGISRELNRSASNRRRPRPVQKVNITALTDMSAKSRRRMFMFGPVKFKPEMDVEAIRKRRSRTGPVNIPIPPDRTGPVMEMKMVKSGGGGGKNGGGVLRPLWCRSHLATALARSFGCVSASMV